MDARDQYWSGRHVAVTGATGFIGHHVALRLAQAGARVTALVRASSVCKRLLAASVQCTIAPLEDLDSLRRGCSQCEVLFHVAGAVDFGNDGELCRTVNVEGTRNVLAAARAAGVRRMIHVSSIVAVGASRRPTLLDESATWNLERLNVPYVTTKRAAEELALTQRGNCDVVVVNPASVVGPDDFSGSEFGRLCKRFWRGCLRYFFGGGNNFVDVRDVASGILLAARHGRSGQRYILGGENRTYAEFFTLLEQASRRPMFRLRLPVFVARAAAAVRDCLPSSRRRPYLSRGRAQLLGWYFHCDSSRATAELGYRPRSLVESLRDAHTFWTRKEPV